MVKYRFTAMGVASSLRALSVALLIGVPSLAFAECGADECADVYIDRIYVRAAGNNLVLTSGNESALTCITDGPYLTIGDTENKKDILSVLMAAQMAKKRVRIVMKPPGSPCEILHVEVNRE